MKQGGVYRNGSTDQSWRKSISVKLLLYWENRVRTREVPMSAIDVTQPVFGLGLIGVVCRQGGTMLEDV